MNASIPAYPMLLENGGTTDLSQATGNIGIMRNGVAMYRYGSYHRNNLFCNFVNSVASLSMVQLLRV